MQFNIRKNTENGSNMNFYYGCRVTGSANHNAGNQGYNIQILDDPSFNLCYIINPANINEFFSNCGLYVVWLFNSRYKIINLYLENNKKLLITCQTTFFLTDQNRKWHVRRPVIGWFLAIVQYAFFPDPFINMLLYGIVISQSVCCILYLLII